PGAGGAAGALQACGPGAALPGSCALVRPTPAQALTLVRQQGKPEPPPLLGLSRSGCLSWGSAVIAPADVTSLAVRAYGPGGPALLYTTRKNLLYTVLFSQLSTYTHRDLTSDPSALRLPKREGEMLTAMHAAMRPDAAITAAARDVAVRALEAGAQLVACPTGIAPSTSHATPAAGVAAAAAPPPAQRLADVPVVLQMPRGNLEGVAPRALVLAALLAALRGRQYGEAWRLAAIHRVDLNLLVDYRWPAFLSHAAEFVCAVARPADL
ncbi:hypothetical protein Agub_g4056, partial [Astrephomene gubernaculifera]